MAHTFDSGVGDVSYGFTYSPASQIATRTRSNDAYASTSAYDVSRPYSVNGLNQYTAAGSTTFSYDANGNLTRSGSTTYTYDVENRLVGASGGRVLRYDPLLRLYQASSTRFAYDGVTLIAEYDSANVLLRRHVHGPGVDEPLVWYEGSGSVQQGGLGQMRQFVAVFSLLLIPSCATAASRDAMQESWCFQDRESQLGQWEQLDDFEVIPAAADAVPRARSALRDRTVLELSPSEAAAFSQRQVSSDGKRNYLIRGALSSAPDTDLSSLLHSAASASFEAHWHSSTQSLTIIIIQTIRGSVVRHNIPFVLRTTLPVRHVYVSCFSMS